MADLSDIPPLEDMTDLLKQAEAIRAVTKESTGKTDQPDSRQCAKQRAKVIKNVNAKVWNHESSQAESGSQPKVEAEKKGKEVTNTQTSQARSNQSSSGKVFGGMKKGFLFGGSPKSSPSNKSVNKADCTGGSSQKNKDKSTEEVPFIAPKKTEDAQSPLTLNEVQEAMSGTEGLLKNQEWVTDDLLDKVEKNEKLLKRFSDPYFMKAIEEFQKNPEAAMAKYKSNKEVEEFMVEFTGLLGKHFTGLGEKSQGSDSRENKTNEKSNLQIPSKQPQGAGDLRKDSPKSALIEEIEPQQSNQKASPKHQSNETSKGSESLFQNMPSPASIQQAASQSDEEVQQLLSNPKTMEILMDPKIMSLIQTLRTDPEKGQRMAEKADVELKAKIDYLVQLGLIRWSNM